ncbi:MAG TPA: DUF2938 domain-containing protein [Steroidobacteraceae bacterium]|nr:DUF2938 domain-containing protein [Steroidobacteraceae bacterium]
MEPVDFVRSALIGIGATAVLDAWLALLKQFGVQGLNFAFLGRWVGHVFRGEFTQPAMAKATPVHRELALGWFSHYAIGVAFAGLLIAVQGTAWLQNPALSSAMLIGVCTVAAPLLIMQPAMGAGFFASRTPTPLKNCLRSIINHSIFGAGLYVSAVVVNLVSR